VDYGVKTTRKGISELISDLGSKGFTMLGVINPSIQPHDQANALIEFFNGEISLTQTDYPWNVRSLFKLRSLETNIM
jgi:hypothetical protein